VLYQAELHPEMDNPASKQAGGGVKDGGARSVLKAPLRSNANLPDPKHRQGLAVACASRKDQIAQPYRPAGRGGGRTGAVWLLAGDSWNCRYLSSGRMTSATGSGRQAGQPVKLPADARLSRGISTVNPTASAYARLNAGRLEIRSWYLRKASSVLMP
jgi:hypothetical protein